MKPTIITKVVARQLIDMACRPMVEVDVVTADGSLGRGSAPTGKSVGVYESFILRDENPDEYDGLSVHKAVDIVNQVIAPELIGQDAADFRQLDRIMIELDGTPDKHRLGGNAIYSASVAILRAAAQSAGLPVYALLADGPVRQVPVPSFNMINGGRNGSITQAINEFIVVPWRAATIDEAVEIAVRTFAEVGRVIGRRTGSEAKVGRSYGWIAPSEDPVEVLEILAEALDRKGYAQKCSFALDCAASAMYDAASGTYYLNGRSWSAPELVDYYRELSARFDFIFMEDLLDENDWDGFALAHRRISRTLIIADDLTVSSRARLEKAHAMDAIDGFILKPNQIGTISEALDAHEYARGKGLISTPSGRSGGVIDDIIMDLAVGLVVPFLKNGCPRSGERIEKLNFLMRVNSLNPGCQLSRIDPLVRF